MREFTTRSRLFGDSCLCRRVTLSLFVHSRHLGEEESPLSHAV